MKLSAKLLALIGMFLCAPAFSQQKAAKPIPRLEKRGQVTQLIVDGQPYLVLGGELHNSNTSSLEYLKPIMAKVAAMHFNTVLGAVNWDLLEPEEGKFDFSLVDGLIKQSRDNKLKLVILWFGSWKNGMSHYVPDWVKKDQARFPRVKMGNGKSTETLNVFSPENLKADAKAFSALMKHIKAIDSKERTVIMIQVENEVGIHGDNRDRSDVANANFSKQVPAELITGLQKHQAELQPEFKQAWEKAGSKTAGTWEDVFGKNAFGDEVFMAWHYAKYVNAITAAGKAEYNVPMYVNAWISPVYPRGGPVAYMHDVWRVAAPKIDIFTPDIYQPDFKGIIPLFHHSWNPLFIPECAADSAGASNAYYAIGMHNAIGYSPFAIEDRVADPINGPIPKAYKVLGGLAPIILDAQAKGTITAVTINKSNPVQTINMGGYNIELRTRRKKMGTERYLPNSSYGIIINSAPDEFIISGVNLEAIFAPSTAGPQIAGIASLWEGVYDNGKWKPGRRLNGDNIMQNYNMTEQSTKNQTGTVVRFENPGPGILKVKLYKFD
ncbi:DUF5597 domain-containing protein [Mucilaginibacter sp.]|uniref:GH35 family beta-galactosidase n=1 Tax=Mucilaginibacter sp. TaxID=1882438 RepID=UPI00261854FB|nr:DUF5597 domain-containing protein [Mucilaginibacter sp.]MDB4925664.1 hypothetical protein [Mucilaginibacter sp.]